jgi:hypothetical protein
MNFSIFDKLLTASTIIVMRIKVIDAFLSLKGDKELPKNFTQCSEVELVVRAVRLV